MDTCQPREAIPMVSHRHAAASTCDCPLCTYHTGVDADRKEVVVEQTEVCPPDGDEQGQIGLASEVGGRGGEVVHIQVQVAQISGHQALLPVARTVRVLLSIDVGLRQQSVTSHALSADVIESFGTW